MTCFEKNVIIKMYNFSRINKNKKGFVIFCILNYDIFCFANTCNFDFCNNNHFNNKNNIINKKKSWFPIIHCTKHCIKIKYFKK